MNDTDEKYLDSMTELTKALNRAADALETHLPKIGDINKNNPVEIPVEEAKKD